MIIKNQKTIQMSKEYTRIEIEIEIEIEIGIEIDPIKIVYHTPICKKQAIQQTTNNKQQTTNNKQQGYHLDFFCLGFCRTT